MMHRLGVDIKVTCKKEEVLKTLEANREQHSKLVAEAREGYLAKARETLEKQLALIREGKVTSVAFTMKVPVDYTSAYTTVIKMLQSHTGNEIEMGASEYRQFMEDEWDWATDFYGSNARYSDSTAKVGSSKGYI